MTMVMAMIMRESWMLLITARLFNHLAQRETHEHSLTNRGEESIPAGKNRWHETGRTGNREQQKEIPATVRRMTAPSQK